MCRGHTDTEQPGLEHHVVLQARLGPLALARSLSLWIFLLLPAFPVLLLLPFLLLLLLLLLLLGVVHNLPFVLLLGKARLQVIPRSPALLPGLPT